MHVENCAAVNRWESDEEELKWIRVRLTGKAQTALQRFPADAHSKYSKCVAALRRRFHPDSKRDLHMMELSVRKRLNKEDWASLGDALRTLADKAYPDLEEKARERFALNQFLSQIDNAQVAFSVRQRHPQTVDEAASATIGLESYVGQNCKPTSVGTVPMQVVEHDEAAVSAVTPSDVTGSSQSTQMKQLVERLDRLEKLLVRESINYPVPGSAARLKDHNREPRQRTVTCWNCGERGHIARNCDKYQQPQQQENSSPLVPRAAHKGMRR